MNEFEDLKLINSTLEYVDKEFMSSYLQFDVQFGDVTNTHVYINSITENSSQ